MPATSRPSVTPSAGPSRAEKPIGYPRKRLSAVSPDDMSRPSRRSKENRDLNVERPCATRPRPAGVAERRQAEKRVLSVVNGSAKPTRSREPAAPRVPDADGATERANVRVAMSSTLPTPPPSVKKGGFRSVTLHSPITEKGWATKAQHDVQDAASSPRKSALKAPAQLSEKATQLRTPPPDKPRTFRLPTNGVSSAKSTFSKAPQKAATHAKGAATRSSLVKPRKDARRGPQEEVTMVSKRYGVQFPHKDGEKKASLGCGAEREMVEAPRTEFSVLAKGEDGPIDTVVATKPSKSVTLVIPLKTAAFALDEHSGLVFTTSDVSPTTHRSSVTKPLEEATPALDLLTELRLALAKRNLLKAQHPAVPQVDIEESPRRKLIEKINRIKLERALADVTNWREAYEEHLSSPFATGPSSPHVAASRLSNSSLPATALAILARAGANMDFVYGQTSPRSHASEVRRA